MTDQRLFKIVFMGTPAFAVPSLEALIAAGFHVAAVVTAPDRPAGRGMKLRESEIKKAAVAHGIPVLQPAKLKDPAFIEALHQIGAQLQVVVAFRMLPEVVWNMPPLGTINLHASLLPQYRGAAPINHAIMHGDTETGVTTFKLKHEIDTGNILLQTRVPISSEDNAGTLHDKLMEAGAELLVETVRGIKEGSVSEISQHELLPEMEIRHAPKIFREDCEINWQRPAKDILNQIRGLSPYPGAFSAVNDRRIIILEARLQFTKPVVPAGTYETDGKSCFKIAAADGYIQIIRLKPEGRRAMEVSDFLRGQRDL